MGLSNLRFCDALSEDRREGLNGVLVAMGIVCLFLFSIRTEAFILQLLGVSFDDSPQRMSTAEKDSLPSNYILIPGHCACKNWLK